MSITSLTKARAAVARAQASSKRAREKAGELMQVTVHAALTGATAYALGVLEGQLDNPKQFEFLGVPIPLAVAVGAHGAALLGVGRGMEQHFTAVGNGALAAHAAGMGRALGAELKARRGGAPAVRGDLPPRRRGAGITQEDLERMATAAA